MIYFLWSLLNLLILVWFLFICFSDLKGIRERLGMVSTVIFVICCFSFIKESLSNNSQIFPADPSTETQITETKNLKHELFFNVDLIYGFSKDSSAKEFPAITVINGFVMGHEWKPVLTKVYFKDNVITYFATGTHEWKLLGLTLYTDPEEFKGELK